MSDKQSISALVTGGEASAGPPLGPALGPLGINVLQVVNTINDKTKDFPGMKVPVKVEVDPETKQFTVESWNSTYFCINCKRGRSFKRFWNFWK